MCFYGVALRLIKYLDMEEYSWDISRIRLPSPLLNSLIFQNGAYGLFCDRNLLFRGLKMLHLNLFA